MVFSLEYAFLLKASFAHANKGRLPNTGTLPFQLFNISILSLLTAAAAAAAPYFVFNFVFLILRQNTFHIFLTFRFDIFNGISSVECFSIHKIHVSFSSFFSE